MENANQTKPENSDIARKNVRTFWRRLEPKSRYVYPARVAKLKTARAITWPAALPPPRSARSYAEKIRAPESACRGRMRGAPPSIIVRGLAVSRVTVPCVFGSQKDLGIDMRAARLSGCPSPEQWLRCASLFSSFFPLLSASAFDKPGDTAMAGKLFFSIIQVRINGLYHGTQQAETRRDWEDGLQFWSFVQEKGPNDFQRTAIKKG